MNSEQMTADFVNTLVVAILGVSINDIPEDIRQQKVNACLTIFSNYILNYIKIKDGSKDEVRLKVANSFGDQTVFDKFPELENSFAEAYTSFLELLETVK